MPLHDTQRPAEDSGGPAPSSSPAAAPAAAPPPPPEGSRHARVACRCLNVELDAHVEGEPRGLARASIVPESEKTKLADFVGDDEDWRTCWACRTKLYRSLPDGVVEIDFDSVLTGAALGAALHEQPLPFSGLLLPIPSSSNFGRPEPAAPPDIYPPAAPAPASAPTLLPPLADPFFLPPPFIPAHPRLRELCRGAEAYLAATHARIEDEVRAYIAARTRETRALEDEVRAEVELLWDRYAAGPARTAAAGAELERKRSTSMSRSTEIRSPAAREGFAATAAVARHENPPAAAQAAASEAPAQTQSLQPPQGAQSRGAGLSISTRVAGAGPAGASLLSASLSANAFYAPPPSTKPAPDDDLFDQLTHRAELGVDREVAMSQVLSAMDELSMGGRREKAAAARARDAAADEAERKEDEHVGRDSWIALERGQVADAEVRAGQREERAKERADRPPRAAGLEPPREDEGEDEGRTPRPRHVKELHGERRPRVKFEEPVKERAKGASRPRGAAPDGDSGGGADDDYVFDFDMADIPGGGDGGTAAQSPPHAPARPRDVVEDNLSQTFAADAPSHRAAWRRLAQSGDLYTALRRGLSAGRGGDDGGDVDDDDVAGGGGDGAVGAFATSMPVDIVRPRGARAVAPVADVPRQRKTSLTDAEGRGQMVPALLAAMRERPAPNTLGLDIGGGGGGGGGGGRGRGGAGARTRSMSHSREREAMSSYVGDAGAVFEVLADGDDDGGEGDDADGGDGEGEAGGERFVPPHVLARRESDRPEVGWRSLAS